MFKGARAHSDETVLRCQDLLETDYARLHVDDLGRRVGLSDRSIRRRFQLAVGMTPHEYLRRARVEAARRQLERTDRTVFEVMDSVGYADRKAFAQTFREVTGLGPAAYRKTHSVRVLATR